MKFSEQWLREWVNPDIDTQELVDILTMAGLEVDGYEPVAPPFDGVVVAEIVAAERHPDAEKLTLCQISTGAESVQVVCGAANARAGLKVALAQVGTKLPGDFKIKKAKLRGAESYGMLCAEEELGLADSSDGILELPENASVGVNLRDYLGLDDQVIEVDLTPNRGDCLSITGLARDTGVLTSTEVVFPEVIASAPSIGDQFPVSLAAGEACPRYVGRVIKGININADSPVWLQERLRRSGIRSIDPVVDVTNYVMLELGQPMHAFDLRRLKGGIEVRLAMPGEKLVLLDGQEVELDSDVLVIADDKGPLAMAGIMGGEGSGVTEKTQDIFLESAFFNPLAIAGRARRYGLHTDSSHRFERGVDFQLQEQAIERATGLLLDIVGGTPGPVVAQSLAEKMPERSDITLRGERLTRVLGIELESAAVEDILVRLGFEITKRDGQSGGATDFTVSVPSYRFDVELEVDLIEEIARVYGYNRLPVRMPSSSLLPKGLSETKIALNNLRQTLLVRGYDEAITYSFVDPKIQANFGEADSTSGAIRLANPISADMSEMRTSIWPGLVGALRYNQHRQQPRVRLFESGQVFLAGENDGDLVQTERLAGLISGPRYPESWSSDRSLVDFYDLKGDVEALLALGGNADDYSVEPANHPALHPGQSAGIRRSGKLIGHMGALHPQVEAALDVKGPVYLFELDVAEIIEGRLPVFNSLSKFPEVRRDLAIIVDKSIALCDIVKIVRSSAGALLSDLRLFDVYEGQGIEPNQKSLALGLIWQHKERTLTDDEINELQNAVVGRLKEDVNAILRG